MTVKIDEDLSSALKPTLNAAGFVALTVVDQGWTGLPDAVLFSEVQSQDEFFVTADAEFGDVSRFPPGTHCGILVLQSVSQSIASFRAVLERVLTEHDLARLRGAVIIASESSIQVIAA